MFHLLNLAPLHWKPSQDVNLLNASHSNILRECDLITMREGIELALNKEINYCLLSHHNFEGGLFLCTDKLSDIYSLSPAVSRVILLFTSLQFSSVWLLSRVRLFVTP